LASIKLYDEYTFAHSVNVAILSIAMGAFLSLEKHKISALGFSGMLHDIGKVTIPLEITNKADALTEAEWTIVKRHPVEGAVILSGMAGVSRLAMVAAFEHHQHYDAKGYPQTRDIVQQHPFSRIVAIADAYDALTSVRVYYNVSTPPDEAVRILLKRRGTVFDTMLVKVFVNMIGILPIGTLLRLDTGEMGLVVHQTRDLVRPRVLLLRTFDGTEKEEVSLLEMERGKYKRSIAGAIDPNRMNINLNQYFT
jgi:HD-GYP domain-containing protein (c-di-GMP phosphodiesterase class II)